MPGPVFETTDALAAAPARRVVRPRARVEAFRAASFEVADGHATTRFVEGSCSRHCADRPERRVRGAPARVRYDTRPVPAQADVSRSTSPSGPFTSAMTFRAKPVVQALPPSVVGEPGPTELLPQPGLRPRRRRRRRHPRRRRRGHVVQRPPRARSAASTASRSPRTSSATATTSRTGGSSEAERRIRNADRGRPPDRRPRPTPEPDHPRSSRQQLASIALERLIDTRIQADLATEEGITVTDADIDARLITEATTPETRHAWVIEVAPQT